MRVMTQGLMGVVLVCVSAAQIVAAAEPRDSETRSDSKVLSEVGVRPVPTNATALTDDVVNIDASSLVELRPDLPVRRYIAGWGWADDEQGNVAGNNSILVYSNTLGRTALGPPAQIPDAQLADDILTTGEPGKRISSLPGVFESGCLLDRYAMMITGDLNDNGTAEVLHVETALYDSCPRAGGPEIPGTRCIFDFDAGESTGLIELNCPVDEFDTVRIPNNHLFLGITFSRLDAGVRLSGPALIGLSVDRLDHPALACGAGLGGFPVGPHASFWAQIFVKEPCEETFPTYKSSNQGGPGFSPGGGRRFADDITLAVEPCEMVALEVAAKGSGVVLFDLRTQLINENPETGGLIIGTRSGIALPGGTDIVIGQVLFDPPIRLGLRDIFVSFSASSAAGGPVVSGKRASVGSTEDFYFVHQSGQWRAVDFSRASTHAAFEVSIICAGASPSGACCDMVLKDDAGDAVCRNVPEMNCAFPTLWEQNDVCEAVCAGGTNDGELCTRQVDCPGSNCVAGTSPGRDCDTDAGCSGGGFCRRAECDGPFLEPCGVSACCTADDDCLNITEPECDALPPIEAPRLFQRATFCGLDAACPRGACIGREGECTLPREATCVAGPEEGEICDPTFNDCKGICIGAGGSAGQECDTVCPSPNDCTRQVCVGGDNAGELCVFGDDSLCPGGACLENNCQGAPGCKDPFCCSAVCARANQDFCCTVHWDSICATDAASTEACLANVANDECFSSDPDDGALLIDVPSIADTDARRATDKFSDPDFCCHQSPLASPEGIDRRGYGTVWYKFHAPAGICKKGPRNNSSCDFFAADPDNSVDGCPDFGACVGGARNNQPCDPHATDPENDVNGCPDEMDDEGTCVVTEEGVCTSSVGLETCGSTAPARDSLIQVFSIRDPDRGSCDDLSVCSVAAQDCFDDSVCVFDEETACGEGLRPIACDDDTEISGQCSSAGGFSQPELSRMCVTDLIPGDLYYILVGAKTTNDLGIYSLNVSTPCNPSDTLMPNDLCENGTPVIVDPTPPDEPLVIIYDLSGGGEYAAATFDCPGPECLGPDRTIQSEIWYDLMPTVDGTMTIETCNGVNNTPDTGLVVHEGCECPVPIGSIVDCNDLIIDADCFLGARITFDVVADQCYKVRLGGDSGGRNCAAWSSELPPPPECIPTGPLTITLDEIDRRAILTGSQPECDTSLWRSQNNFMLLTFDRDLASTPTSGQIVIRELQAGGAFGPDLSPVFSFAVENDGGGNPRVLRITENGSILTHATWVAVLNTGGWTDAEDFEMDYRVYVGDVNNDGLVLSQDAGVVTLDVPCFVGCNEQTDVNGDGLVLSQDAGIVTLNVPFFGTPKPDGHGCLFPTP